MKANEAPEKIYLVKDRDTNKPMDYWYSATTDDSRIEYIRKDTFIEKAMRFLKEWNAYRVCLEGHKDWFIEQFKKYMEE